MCKVVILLTRSTDCFWLFSLSSPLSITRFYTLCRQTQQRELRNCQTYKTSVAFTYFLYRIDPSLKIKLCASQHVNDNEKIKILLFRQIKVIAKPYWSYLVPESNTTLREETEDNCKTLTMFVTSKFDHLERFNFFWCFYFNCAQQSNLS